MTVVVRRQLRAERDINKPQILLAKGSSYNNHPRRELCGHWPFPKIEDNLTVHKADDGVGKEVDSLTRRVSKCQSLRTNIHAPATEGELAIEVGDDENLVSLRRVRQSAHWQTIQGLRLYSEVMAVEALHVPERLPGVRG